MSKGHIISGERFKELVGTPPKNLKDALIRSVLAAAEGPYYLVTEIRNRCYDWKLLSAYQSELPVISVGNLTLGGTGKTPLVAWLAKFFTQQGYHPALISRGYHSEKNGHNDEYRELALRLPEVPHRQNPNRIAAVKEFIADKQHHVDLFILDDAMQHRKIQRDLEIVLLDATEPFGFEHLFPRGTLRESLRSLKRADVILLSRANLIDSGKRTEIHRQAKSWAPKALWAEIVHDPEKVIAFEQNQPEIDLNELKGKRIVAFCGIGNPQAFTKTLEDCHMTALETVVFPDHHHYCTEDMDRIARIAEKRGAERVLCTMKDLVKIQTWNKNSIPLAAVAIDIRFLEGEQSFRQRLAQLIKKE